MKIYTSPVTKTIVESISYPVNPAHPITPATLKPNPPTRVPTTTSPPGGGVWMTLQQIQQVPGVTWTSYLDDDEALTDTGSAYVGTVTPATATSGTALLWGELDLTDSNINTDPLPMRVTFVTYSDTAPGVGAGEMFNPAAVYYGRTGSALNDAPPTTAFKDSPIIIQQSATGGTTPALATFTMSAKASDPVESDFGPTLPAGGGAYLRFTVEFETSPGVWTPIQQLSGVEFSGPAGYSAISVVGDEFIAQFEFVDGAMQVVDGYPGSPYGVIGVILPGNFTDMNTRVTVLQYDEWFVPNGAETYRTSVPASVGVFGQTSVELTGEYLTSYPTTQQSVLAQTYPTNPTTMLFTPTNQAEYTRPRTLSLYITAPEFEDNVAANLTVTCNMIVEFLVNEI